MWKGDEVSEVSGWAKVKRAVGVWCRVPDSMAGVPPPLSWSLMRRGHVGKVVVPPLETSSSRLEAQNCWSKSGYFDECFFFFLNI